MDIENVIKENISLKEENNKLKFLLLILHFFLFFCPVNWAF